MEKTKETATKKAPAKKKLAKSDSYVCEVCGLAVSIDETCNCVDVCDIICCGSPMKEKKAKGKSAVRK